MLQKARKCFFEGKRRIVYLAFSVSEIIRLHVDFKPLQGTEIIIDNERSNLFCYVYDIRASRPKRILKFHNGILLCVSTHICKYIHRYYGYNNYMVIYNIIRG